MANPNLNREYIIELTRNLTSDRLHLINFDQLKEWLLAASDSLEKVETVKADLVLLRSEFVNRIAGMVKAIAAVERSSSRVSKALTYLENLQELGAAELIEEYQKTSARFRSAFPTTFGLAPSYISRSNGLKNPEVYK